MHGSLFNVGESLLQLTFAAVEIACGSDITHMLIEPPMVTFAMVEENNRTISLCCWNMTSNGNETNTPTLTGSFTIDCEGTVGSVKLSTNFIVCTVDRVSVALFLVSSHNIMTAHSIYCGSQNNDHTTTSRTKRSISLF
jgi:hypothetical protein